MQQGTSWTVGEWLTLAGIIVAIASTFAVPFGMWMTKMWTNQKLTMVHLKNLRGRVRRLETNKTTAHITLSEQVSSTEDRINEHAEHIADHGARIVVAENEIKNIRVNQHNLSNQIMSVQGNHGRGKGSSQT